MEGLVRGYGDVAVTPHHLSTQAAMEIYRVGGNAVDAAIAANAVQGVVAPETCGIGGDLFALVHVPGDPLPFCLNASGWAGSNNTADSVTEESMPLFGPHSVTIPGAVAGWQELHERFGRLPWARLFDRAIGYAEEGFFVSEELAGSLERRGGELLGQEIAETLMPGGAPAPLESRLRRPDLAHTLTVIAARGRAGFYEGHVAGEVSRAVGNLITVDDMAGYDPAWVRPLGIPLFGRQAWTIPPNSQGYLTLGTLRLMEMVGGAESAADVLHLQIEAYRALAWERDDICCDPNHAPLTIDELISEERLAGRAERIRMDRTATWPDETEPVGGTAYLAFLDAEGLGISLIQSNFHGFGTTIGAGDAGFLLHNRGGSFVLTEGHPNQLAPGKRPLHTLSPTLWTRNDRLDTILGTRGGHQQPQLLTRVAWELFANGADPESAQATPRWTTRIVDRESSSTILLEAGAGESADELRSRGHDVEVVTGPTGGWGPVSVIHVGADGLRSAAADPRVRVSSANIT